MPSFNTSQSQQRGTSRNRSTQRTGIVPGTLGMYQQQIAKQNENYGNILTGYQTAQQNLGQQLQGAYQGYNDLERRVMGTLQGQGATQYELNRRAASQAQGQSQQRMISGGLVNSSVLASMSNQNMLNYNLSNQATTEGLMRQVAGQQSQIGLARQGAMMQGAGQAANLAGSYLGDLAGYHFGNLSGSLTGSFGQSSGNSQNNGNSSSFGQSVESPMGGGRGGGGMGPIPGEPYHQGGGQSLAGTGYGDVSMGGLYSPGYSPGGNMMAPPAYGGGLTNFNATPTPESGGGYAGSNFSSNYPDIYRGLS